MMDLYFPQPDLIKVDDEYLVVWASIKEDEVPSVKFYDVKRKREIARADGCSSFIHLISKEDSAEDPNLENRVIMFRNWDLGKEKIADIDNFLETLLDEKWIKKGKTAGFPTLYHMKVDFKKLREQADRNEPVELLTKTSKDQFKDLEQIVKAAGDRTPDEMAAMCEELDNWIYIRELKPKFYKLLQNPQIKVLRTEKLFHLALELLNELNLERQLITIEATDLKNVCAKQIYIGEDKQLFQAHLVPGDGDSQPITALVDHKSNKFQFSKELRH